MKTNLIIFFVLISLLVNTKTIAQNYTLFNSQQTYLYIDQQSYYSVEFESSQLENQDSVLIIYSNVSGFIPCNPFVGQKTIKYNDGKYLFLNNAMDSIVIKSSASLNSSWKIYKYPDGGYLQGTVSGLTKETIFNGEDSIKNITIERFDSGGNKLSDIYPAIKISKTMGLIQAPRFVSFPSITSACTLIGHENPEEGLNNLKAKAIFNFDVNNEFHYYYNYYNNLSHDHQTTQRWTILKVINKNITSSNYQYTFEKTSKEIFSKIIIPTPAPPASGSYTTTTYDQQTYNLQIDFNGHSANIPLNHPDFVPSQYIRWANMSNVDTINDRMIKRIDRNGQSGSSAILYGDGIGLLSSENFPTTPYYYEKTTEKLVYYLKGTETWGTPLMRENLVSAIVDQDFKTNNPYLKETDFIYNSTNEFDLDIFNCQGQLIRSFNNIQGPATLSLNDLYPSLYIYVVNSGDKILKGSFALVK